MYTYLQASLLRAKEYNTINIHTLINLKMYPFRHQPSPVLLRIPKPLVSRQRQLQEYPSKVLVCEHLLSQLTGGQDLHHGYECTENNWSLIPAVFVIVPSRAFQQISHSLFWYSAAPLSLPALPLVPHANLQTISHF